MNAHKPEQEPHWEELGKLRTSIDQIDEQILNLINERARVVQQVGKLKQESSVDFYIPTREKAIFDRLYQQNPGPLPANSVHDIFREIISACRAMETVLSVAYLGPEGSYHHSAAQERFGRAANFVPVETIGDVFTEVERQRTDFGMAAIENSIEGSVAMTLDRLAHTDTTVVGEIYLPVSHNLISYSELHDIEKVYSHPQAIAQCRRWLESNLPHATIINTHSTTQGVIVCKEERKSAAIASSLAAEIFDVPIQVHEIEDYVGNTTRFYVIGRKFNPPTGDDKTAMIVFLRNKAGALYSMLEPFNRVGINLTNIVSRPTRQENWQYMFFLECEAHAEEKRFQDAIRQIEDHSLYVKVLGSFHRSLNASSD